MGKPFNFVQAAILKALAEALFHDTDMAIPSSQVVANLQRQFALVKGGKATEIGLSLYLLCLVMGGPLFLILSPAWRARQVARRLERTRNDLMQDLARVRSVVYAGYYGHWQGETQDDNRDNPVLAQIGFTLPAHRDRSAPGCPCSSWSRSPACRNRPCALSFEHRHHVGHAAGPASAPPLDGTTTP